MGGFAGAEIFPEAKTIPNSISLSPTFPHTHQGRRAGRPRQEEPELSGGPPSEDSTWNKPSTGSQRPQNTPGPKQTGSLVTIHFCACSRKKKATLKTLYSTRQKLFKNVWFTTRGSVKIFFKADVFFQLKNTLQFSSRTHCNSCFCYNIYKLYK